MDSEVGFGATSILEGLCKESILINYQISDYSGLVESIQKYLELRMYNRQRGK